MKPHKWHKEIKAWADGAEIECFNESKSLWEFCMFPEWEEELYFRISPTQPKEPIINIDELGRNYTRALHDSLIKHKQNLEIEIANIIHEALNEIKPQPKEPQYLYVYQDIGKLVLEKSNTLVLDMNLIGKIKLEVDDE
jgi:hypothetical protein